MFSCSQSYEIAEAYLVLLHCWAFSNFKTLLMFCLPYYIAESYLVLLHCWAQSNFTQGWCIPCLFTLLRSCQSCNPADVNRDLFHCSDFLNLKTLLRHILSYYIAEMFPILERYWRKTCPVTLLSFSQFMKLLRPIFSFYIAELFPTLKYCWCLFCHIILLKQILSHHTAHLFPIFKQGWCILCPITLLRCSQSWSNADLSP